MSGLGMMGKHTWRMTGFGNLEQKASNKFDHIKFDNHEIIINKSHESH